MINSLFKKLYVLFEIMLGIFLVLILFGFILDLNNLLITISHSASKILIWPYLSDFQFWVLILFSVIKYVLLFLIPVLGFIFCPEKNKIHLILASLTLFELMTFLYAILFLEIF